MSEPESVDTKEHPVFWCTRDEGPDGVLSETVDVWLSRPARNNLPGGGCAWLGLGDIGLEDRYAQWSLANCRKQCYTVPDTSRECLVVG